MLLPWLVSTFHTRIVPPRAIARPRMMAMINRAKALLFRSFGLDLPEGNGLKGR